MRSLMIAGVAMVTAAAAVPADAQRIAEPGRMAPQIRNQPGAPMRPQIRPRGPWMSGGAQMGMRQHRFRWGGAIGGRWHAGVHAPGGWNAYRRPWRGWTLPRYWIAPSFFIGDFASYGLARPPLGYHWSRYYDDAVLIDDSGRVWDSVSGIEWDGDDGYSDYGYAEDEPAGRDYGADYPPPGPGYGGGAPRIVYAPPMEVVQDVYSGSYSSSGGYAGHGYASNGYWYPPATTTVVTVQSAPVVTTTTTTEYVETRYVPKRTVRRVIKRKPRPIRRQCVCTCSPCR